METLSNLVMFTITVWFIAVPAGAALLLVVALGSGRRAMSAAEQTKRFGIH